jgi:hypothetical protein
MKVIGAFAAALGAAAIVFALELLAEDIFGGMPLSLSIIVFGIGLNLLVGLPVVVIGGVPIWLVFRYFGVRSPWAFAFAGACLAVCAYHVLVAMGMGQASDHPMSFRENLDRSFHVPRIAAAMLAGGVGATVFWLVARMPDDGCGDRYSGK